MSESPIAVLDTPSDLAPPPSIAKHHTHLSYEERITARALYAKGLTINAISKQLKRDHHSISRAVSNPKEVMLDQFPRRLRDWAKASKIGGAKGDHTPAKEWGLYCGAIEQLEDRTAQTGVTVVVGLVPPGLGLSPSSPTLIGQAIPVSDEE